MHVFLLSFSSLLFFIPLYHLISLLPDLSLKNKASNSFKIKLKCLHAFPIE